MNRRRATSRIVAHTHARTSSSSGATRPVLVGPLAAELPDVFRSESRPDAQADVWGEVVGLQTELADDLFAVPSQEQNPTPPLESRPDKPRVPAQVLARGAIVDNKYRIEEVIGTGGFAVVHRATHLVLGMPVAIKMLRNRDVRPEDASALVDEAKNAARIDHPNVVRIIDVAHAADATYIVMEFIDGETLQALIRRRGHVDPLEAARIGLDVARGLSAGHDCGLVHRDIKPANILVARAGHAKIVDLGLARRTDGAQRTRGIAGTPGYIAPEQLVDGARADFRSDMYALGVTLFEAVVGRPPFPTDDPDRNRQLHVEAVPPEIETLVPDVTPGFSRLIAGLLSKSPDHRPRSYARLIEAFVRAAEELESASRRVRARDERRKQRRTAPR